MPIGCDALALGGRHLVKVLKDGAELDEAKFFDYCKENLVKYKRPVEVHFIDALPRTGTNKIDRMKLRTMAKGEE